MPMKLTLKEQKNLEAWKERENWTREKSLNSQFNLFGESGDSMPTNLIAPDVKGEWCGKGKCVCVMCGYATTVTNLCRQCREMPTTRELIRPMVCYHHETVHSIEKGGKKIPTTHQTIAMVKVG